MNFIRSRWQLFLFISLGIMVALAGLLLIADVEGAKTPLQIWILFNLAAFSVLVVTSRQVHESRYWYGTDWWLVVFSVIGLLVFTTIATIPEVLAPYDYDEEAGLEELAPGEQAGIYLLITRTELNADDFGDIGIDPTTGEMVADIDAPLLAVFDERSGRLAGIELQNDNGNFRIDRTPIRNKLAPRDVLRSLSTADLTQPRPLVAVLGRDTELEGFATVFPNLEIAKRVEIKSDKVILFGTNRLGQDVFSRLIYGTRTTLIIGIAAALLSSLVGIPLGLLSAYWGGTLDRILTPFMDTLYSFPGLILAIALASVRGPGIDTVIIAIAVIYVPIYFRVIRSQTLTVKEMAYVEAAHSLGANELSILSRYVFPNVLASTAVVFTINIAEAILTGAALSFLGLGLPPDGVPDWGLDLNNGISAFPDKWWLVTFPGIAIALLTLSFSILGESLSEILNPRTGRTQ